MRANSLALRLFLSATTWTVVILLVTGVILSTVYRHAEERSFDRRLGVYLKTLVADVASPEESGEKFPQSIGEPLFDLPLSGWYWQVTRLDQQKPDVHSSRSLWDSALPRLDERKIPPDATGSRQGYVEGPEEQRLRLVERTIDLGDDGRFLIAVAGDAAEIEGDMRGFDEALTVTFCVLAVVLLLTTTFQVQFGLAPLKRISEGLAAIRSGTAERLEGRFPEEIAPLARETNALIEANREIIERARTHVGNLAHALKTPLSVIVNEAASRGEDAFAVKVREQTAIMRDQVTRHLERARLAAGLSTIGTVTEIRPVLVALARTMEKIHHDRGIAIDVEAPDNLRFRGERQDLEEMVGNLVDNACKWAKSRVAVEVAQPRRDASNPRVSVLIDDDGPGLSASEREEVQAPRRGRRLDETKPGSGLGLSIVVELAGLYGGELSLETAPIGGLRAELVLPAA
ncbi:MAG TPA: sensor histidine kinase [Xanthobacteraceae bacterium]|nr:sensor histidine kinase [Xanthobacteraceae bacterium]